MSVQILVSFFLLTSCAAQVLQRSQSVSSQPPYPLPTIGCHEDNCLRALENQLYASSAYKFCNTFMATSIPTASSSGVPTYLNNCGPTSIIPAISSACPCFLATYKPSMISTSFKSTSTTTTRSTSVKPSLPTQGCHEDNCLRALENHLYAMSGYTFCNSFLGTTISTASTAGIPSFLANCGPTSMISAISSACPCFLATYHPVTMTSSISSGSTAPSGSSAQTTTSTSTSPSSSPTGMTTSSSTAPSSSSTRMTTSSSIAPLSSSTQMTTSSSTTQSSGPTRMTTSGSTTPSSSFTQMTTSSSTTPSSTSISPYNPTIPTNYSNCLLDPTNSSNTIELIDQNTGISFIDVNGYVVLANNTITNLTDYTFTKTTNGPPGVFDLVSDDGLYVAVFSNGYAGFVSKSSNGQTFVSDSSNGETYVTTIWSVDCNGTLTAGIIGGTEYTFGIGGPASTQLIVTELDPSLTKRQAGLVDTISLILFLKVLLEARSDLGIDDPRCSDPSLDPVELFGARAPSYNGCGSGPFIFNYGPFVQCCNDHDLCYDNCDITYLDCNSVFASCTWSKCLATYPGTTLSSEVQLLGCQRLSATFAWIVESEIGRIVFEIANSQRCTCCPPGQIDCSAGCTDPLTDSNNCGSCGVVCGEGSECVNGACSNQVCNGATCGGFQNCGGGTNCFCFTASDGTGFCADNQYCDELAGCSTTADCGEGDICAVGTCCGDPVCMPGVCSVGERFLMMRGVNRNTTAASLNGWIK